MAKLQEQLKNIKQQVRKNKDNIKDTAIILNKLIQFAMYSFNHHREAMMNWTTLAWKDKITDEELEAKLNEVKMNTIKNFNTIFEGIIEVTNGKTDDQQGQSADTPNNEDTSES